MFRGLCGCPYRWNTLRDDWGAVLREPEEAVPAELAVSNSRLAQKVRSFQHGSAMTGALRVAAVVAMLATLAACHKKTDDITRNQQQYDVVNESAGGTVSSTVGAPGEASTATTATAQTTTVTATSLDTTTSFTVGGVTSTGTNATATDGSLAGTLPPIAGAPAADRPRSAPPSRDSSRARTRSDRPPRETDDRAGTTSSSSTIATTPRETQAPPPETATRAPEPPPRPPDAETPATDTRPPATDTTSTSSPPQV
jgi:hypothetical protein